MASPSASAKRARRRRRPHLARHAQDERQLGVVVYFFGAAAASAAPRRSRNAATTVSSRGSRVSRQKFDSFDSFVRFSSLSPESRDGNKKKSPRRAPRAAPSPSAASVARARGASIASPSARDPDGFPRRCFESLHHRAHPETHEPPLREGQEELLRLDPESRAAEGAERPRDALTRALQEQLATEHRQHQAHLHADDGQGRHRRGGARERQDFQVLPHLQLVAGSESPRVPRGLLQRREQRGDVAEALQRVLHARGDGRQRGFEQNRLHRVEVRLKVILRLFPVLLQTDFEAVEQTAEPGVEALEHLHPRRRGPWRGSDWKAESFSRSVQGVAMSSVIIRRPREEAAFTTRGGGGGAVARVAGTEMDDRLAQIRRDVVGADASFDGPFGRKAMLYADWTASGRALVSVEDYVRDEVLPLYANTHTTTSTCGPQSTCFRQEARQLIAQA